VDDAARAEAAQWLVENEDDTAMTPERLAALEAEQAEKDADAIDEAVSPVAGRRFSRA
jgi:(E)-4-hydroxy-3-methylbut-2-enyl-diphosphate synthase